jgi:hypothetical protein
MKKLFYSLIIIIFGLYLVDRLGGIIMGMVNENSKDVLAPKLKYISNDIHEDLVFMGASRCHHHYIPSIISDSVGMTVYNAGVGGADNIFSHYIVLSHILERYAPKVICLEVMPTDYNIQQDPFSVITFFSPLFGRSERADSVYRLAGTYWKYKVSHLYRYNAKASSNLWGMLLNRQKDDDHGYMPLPEPRKYPQTMTKESVDKGSDPLKMEYLSRFAGLCHQNNIKLLFVVSPKYTHVGENHYAILKDFAASHSIPFLDYHTIGLYHDHPEYFKDMTHLWDKGAKIYSSVFAGDLKRILKK